MHLYYEHDQVSLYYTNRMFVKRFFFFSDFFSLWVLFFVVAVIQKYIINCLRWRATNCGARSCRRVWKTEFR